MPQLKRADAHALLEFVADAHASDRHEPFTTELLDRLAAVTASEFATFHRLDFARGVSFAEVHCTNARHYAGAGRASGEWRLPNRALDAAASAPDGIVTWSSAFRRAARKGYEPFAWAAEYAVIDAAVVPFRISAAQGAIVVLHRQERDFGPYDRFRLAALRAHFVAIVRAADARRALRDAAGADADELLAGASGELTRRELVVLRAVAAGRSTAEIAAALFVAPSTVSKHLEHIYRKLGVTSRTAALAALGLTRAGD